MSLRCKQGDLAIVVGSFWPENNGKVVKCLEFLGDDVSRFGTTTPLKDWWLIDRSLTVGSGNGGRHGEYTLAADSVLLPISPPDNMKEIEDELALVGEAE